MHEPQLIINGRDAAALGSASFERRNPISNDIASRAAAASIEDATRAVDAAAAAFKEWRKSGPALRRRLLNEAAAKLEAAEPEIAEAMMNETGATRLWGKINIHLAADMLREAAAITTQVSGQIIPSDVADNLALAVRQPAGVSLGIAPWNAPVILGVRAVATALACGNAVVLKGSETCPQTHYLVAKCLVDAGFPEGVVNYITNAPDDAAKIVETMVAHPATKRVNFTGSTRVGRMIGQVCAAHLKPVILELGGKAPMLVLDDADLDQAVAAAAFGAFSNCGQICMSTEKIIVDERVADEFIERLVKHVSGFQPARASAGPLGSVVGMPTVEHCNALIDDALAHGATLLCGGKADSTFMEATLLDKVTPDMRIFHEESFGPVKGICRVADVGQAIEYANHTVYGLSSAIFSKDVGRALRIAELIDSGICHINSPKVQDEPQMPFGGTKHSGLGRFGGEAGIAAFTEQRWVTIQTAPRQYPF